MKQLYIDAVCGLGVPYRLINKLTKEKLGHWVGGFVDNWTWDKAAVAKLSVKQLKALYADLKEKRF